MTKHQTMFYLRYGKLINDINNKIIVSDVKSDMIKFLNIIPGTLKQPETFQFINTGILKYKNNYKTNNKSQGRFKFEIIKLSKIIYIDFDGNNNFHIWTYIKWPYPYNNSEFYVKWTSIDKIKCYVELYQNDFNNIIE